MKFIAVELYSDTASFRNPDFQNYHKTLHLPPPTTIVGLMGAALGLSPLKAQDFFENNNFRFGVYGKSEAYVKDLWKYRDLNGKRSIIKKEILFYNTFIIVYLADDNEVINQLENAFLYPKYALTMGSSDSLAFVKKVSVINIHELEKCDKLQNCIIEGHIINEVIENIHNGIDISIYTSSDPVTYDLPVKFLYENEYGIRSINKRKQFSFITIGKEMKINLYKYGVFYDDKFIPICSV